MRRLLPWAVAGLMLCLATPALSQDILVWDKDHNKTFTDPEGAGSVDACYGITKALTDNGETFTKVTVLPSDLTPYNILFVIMGTYC